MAQIDNLTVIESDPLADTDMKKFQKQMEKMYDILEYADYVTETITMVLSIIVIFANLFLILAISRNSKLKTKTNTYIFHYAIWFIVFVMSSSLFYAFLTLTTLERYTPYIVYSIIYDISKFSVILTYLFGVGLGVDWLFNVYNPKLGETYVRFNNYILLILYGFGILYFMADITLSTMRLWQIRRVITQISFYTLLVVAVVFNLLDRRKTETQHKSYSLTICNIIFVCWIPTRIYSYLLYYTYGSYTLYSILLFTYFITELFEYSSSIVIAVVLTKCNIFFEIEFWKLFKRQVKGYEGDVENIAESDEDGNIRNNETVSNMEYL